MGTLQHCQGTSLCSLKARNNALCDLKVTCRFPTMQAPARASAQEQPVLKTAVITGGTRGIGFAIAKSLARDGYGALVLGYNSDSSAAGAAQHYLEEHFGGVSVHTVRGDVADRKVLQAMFGVLAVHHDNRCTAFIHNAGLIAGFTSQSDYEKSPSLLRDPTKQVADPLDVEMSTMIDNFDYYFKVYTLCFQLGLKLAMQCQGLQHIIGISAPGCNLSQSPRLSYDDKGQGKAGMEYLIRVTAKALAKKGVNCNAIIPGNVMEGGTTLVYNSSDPRNKQHYDDRLAATTGRWVDAAEIGGVVSFLCSPAGSAINGMAIPVDNGLHLFGC